MPAKTILSRPVYGTLSPQTGKNHLFVADAEGASAILDLAKKAPDGFFAGAHIMFIPETSRSQFQAPLRALKPAQFYEGPSIAAALPRLRQTLANAHMGLRIYLAGTEGLIGQAMQVALEAGIDHSSIQTEHRGSWARRVQCVHCKGITENVTTQPATCAHCGLLLLVRDHYSRRLAAFQGVCINAEDPSEIPQKEEIFR
ncbi:dimethylamine monooxygenase subunit DmmA family protein [Mesorhizobium sp. NPDC059054]|uniref:dimethylamine monooxygenase subunit DmmA family protein n=1 Tax=unclassified Mesorhizobium TaxID=325217 RepID=UPI0006C773D3|nr:dimethylamine monooxygenase subunit DmmA family protein [Mesorhizobium sp. 1M-11]